MDIRYFHLYNRLVRRKQVEPLTCGTCGDVYVLRVNGEEPFLQCFGCNSTVKPGLNLYSKVVAVVREHFE